MRIFCAASSSELQRRPFRRDVFEPENGWSACNFAAVRAGARRLACRYPDLAVVPPDDHLSVRHDPGVEDADRGDRSRVERPGRGRAPRHSVAAARRRSACCFTTRITACVTAPREIARLDLDGLRRRARVRRGAEQLIYQARMGAGESLPGTKPPTPCSGRGLSARRARHRLDRQLGRRRAVRRNCANS